MMPEPPGPGITVEVGPVEGGIDGLAALRLAAGATLADALELLEVGPDSRQAAGIWGRPAGLDTPLRQGDRIEFYRPLRKDPKAARRARAARPLRSERR